MNAFVSLLSLHWGTITEHVVALAAAIISSWPVTPPRMIDDWWTWIRESFQSLLPVNRRQSAAFPTVQTTKAQEQVPASSTAVAEQGSILTPNRFPVPKE